ncbi:MAG: PH domain-containing protein [Gemella haemolysans]|uniref:PH domain-containing protein n=1 Tax=Gemella haemolysans TaxID=1379 RepID=UPI002909F4F5|nr:PH domain-containing protein [Gemella haemolysans]MDU6572985.1 PH domain-containing protein [Gemella haemolysans]
MNRIFEKKSRNLPEKSIQYVRVHFGIYALGLLSPVIGKSVYDYFKTEINYTFLGLGILVILIIYSIVALVIPPLLIRNYSYEVDEMGVSRVEGVFFKNKKTLPYNTIQDVTINTGPILNKYKLANIQVTGIYSKLIVDYLPIEEAEKLKKKILKERSKYNIEY